MRIVTEKNRYIYDPLYKIIYLPDFIWEIISTPEIQRLREVRLCNINSYSLTGCANINRYEHAIGTLHLMQECLENWPPLIRIPNANDQKILLLAALMHDIVSAPFGHSIEYIENKEGFQHEAAFDLVISGNLSEQQYNYQRSSSDPIFFGFPRLLLKKIKEELKLDAQEINKIGQYIRGRGDFGPLISGTIDLDNIDNVYRMAYHIGIVESGKSPIELAQSLYIQNNQLVIKKENIELVREWHNVRKKLYKFLLLNPEEFSAKCMLTEAIELHKITKGDPILWNYTDYDLLSKLYKNTKKLDIQRDHPDILPVQDIVKRLVTGNLYGCICIISSENVNAYEKFINFQYKIKMENNINKLLAPESSMFLGNFSEEIQQAIRVIKGISYDVDTKQVRITIDLNEKMMNNLISNGLNDHQDEIKNLFDLTQKKYKKFKIKNPKIALHSIIDDNKTERQIKIIQDDNNEIIIGNRSKDLLIGVFLRNAEWSMYKIKKLDKNYKLIQEIKQYFIQELEDPSIRVLEKYGEKEYV